MASNQSKVNLVTIWSKKWCFSIYQGNTKIKLNWAGNHGESSESFETLENDPTYILVYANNLSSGLAVIISKVGSDSLSYGVSTKISQISRKIENNFLLGRNWTFVLGIPSRYMVPGQELPVDLSPHFSLISHLLTRKWLFPELSKINHQKLPNMTISRWIMVGKTSGFQFLILHDGLALLNRLVMPGVANLTISPVESFYSKNH